MRRPLGPGPLLVTPGCQSDWQADGMHLTGISSCIIGGSWENVGIRDVNRFYISGGRALCKGHEQILGEGPFMTQMT